MADGTELDMGSNELSALKANLTYKTLWWIGAFICFTVCFSVAVNAYVKLHSEPSWVKVTVEGIAAFVYIISPGALLAKIERRHRRFVSDFADRLTRIEASIDPGRSSSRLNRDGTSPEPGAPQ